MIKTIRLFLIFFSTQLLISPLVMGKSMQIDQPFFKVYFQAESVAFGIVVNGFEVYFNNKGGPITLEIPINQFVRSGENKFELQLQTWNDEGDLSIKNSAFINVEYRLYIDLNNYVVLNKQVYSAKNNKQSTPFKDSSKKGQYSINDNKLITDNTGEYSVSDIQINIDKANYDANYLSHIVTMPTPFPEWKFLTSDTIPDRKQFKTIEQLIDGLIGAPFKVLEKIHTALNNKDLESIMPLFKERNDEMDKAFYYEPGTYEKMLREAFEDDFIKGRLLKDIDINKAKPMISPGKNVVQIGSSPLIVFYNKNKSVFMKYDIYFRKNGDKWIITR